MANFGGSGKSVDRGVEHPITSTQRDHTGRSVKFALWMAGAVAAAVLGAAAVFADPASRFDVVQGVAASLQAVGVVAALVYTAHQLKQGTELRAQAETDQRIDRTLAMHLELMQGHVGESRARLSTHLFTDWFTMSGAQITGFPYQPTRVDLSPKGEFNRYKRNDNVTPVEDLLRILWHFERIEAARQRRILDEDLAVKLLGYSAVRWDAVLARVKPEDEFTDAREALRSLATWSMTVAEERFPQTAAIWCRKLDWNQDPVVTTQPVAPEAA
ncbi:MAG: hypothetical protein ACH37Z_06645 [Anaerolineae bacterium]